MWLPAIPKILPHRFGLPWEKPAAAKPPPGGPPPGGRPPPPRPTAAVLASGWYIKGQQSNGNDVAAGPDDGAEYWVTYRAPDPTQPIAWAETVTWKRTDGSQASEQDSGTHDNAVQPYRHVLKAFDQQDGWVTVDSVLSQGSWSASLRYTLTNIQQPPGTGGVAGPPATGGIRDSGFVLPDGSRPSGNSLQHIDPNGPDFAYWIDYYAPDPGGNVDWSESVTYLHVDGSTGGPALNGGSDGRHPFSRNVRSHGSNDAREIVVVVLSQGDWSASVTFVIDYAPAG